MQVDAVGVSQGTGAMHTAGHLVMYFERRALLRNLAELFSQRGFQAARTGAKK
jgi:hypothetical protein